ncbi:MAG TPA: pilus assembly protein N-terminal domain-containing protein [Armatimonadota bacterium]|nr:pilus assembly protein N-terminal domain-containing protein [Armatimonadota bacterium]
MKIGLILIITVALWPGVSQAITLPTDKHFVVGDTEIIECKDLTRVAVGDPIVADVAPLSSSEVLVNAKSPGKTVLYVWDSSGRRVFNITVQSPIPEIEALCAMIQDQLNDPRITVKVVGDSLVLEGSVAKAADSSRAEAIAKAVLSSSTLPSSAGGVYTVANTSADKVKVVNLVRVEVPADEVTPEVMESANVLKQALNNPNLAVRALPGGMIIVEGKVGTQAQLDRIATMIQGWQGPAGAAVPGGDVAGAVQIINAVAVDSSVARQIVVRAQVVDINRTALKDFGVDWGRVVFEKSDVPGVTATASVQDQPFLIGQSQFGPMDLFGGGKIERFDPIGARIRALQEQNKAKVLSEPNLTVLDGREASILVGGELPIPVVQSAQIGAAASVSIVFKEFGVRLKMLPVITSENTLQLTVMPEVSSLDFANGVVFSGFAIPAFRTRRAETTVNIRDGQSLIIGGLLQNEQSKLVRQIPILGDIPIIGELFKTRSFTNNETELVIIVTPQIVNPTANPT